MIVSFSLIILSILAIFSRESNVALVGFRPIARNKLPIYNTQCEAIHTHTHARAWRSTGLNTETVGAHLLDGHSPFAALVVQSERFSQPHLLANKESTRQELK